VAAVAAVAAFVVGTALCGWRLLAAKVDIDLPFPPLMASWLPHVGPGTVPAIAIAAAVVVRGPGLAERLTWRPLLWLSWAAAVAWTLSLALIDGWQRGVAGRLTTGDEYLHDLPLVTGVPAMLRGFADHILTRQVDPAQTWFWTTHVGAHPPGAFLVFVLLDRIGLSGGGPAAVLVVLIGASAPPAIAVTVAALGHRELARRVLPFSVLFPGAIWVGVSADGMFAGWLAWGIALLALGATMTGPRADLASLGAGPVLGFCLYLSYGLVVAGLLPVAVLTAVTFRRLRNATLAALGVLLVVGAFIASGFWWLDGYEKVRVIYAASIASTRPYSYFVWADLAAFALAIGPAAVAALRRVPALPRACALLVAAAVTAILLADLSGMSKAEVERIWLPFGVWTVVACATLPHPRHWLAAQALLALLINHLLFTTW
jgi:methylthioxylose transferase